MDISWTLGDSNDASTVTNIGLDAKDSYDSDDEALHIVKSSSGSIVLGSMRFSLQDPDTFMDALYNSEYNITIDKAQWEQLMPYHCKNRLIGEWTMSRIENQLRPFLIANPWSELAGFASALAYSRVYRCKRSRCRQFRPILARVMPTCRTSEGRLLRKILLDIACCYMSSYEDQEALRVRWERWGKPSEDILMQHAAKVEATMDLLCQNLISGIGSGLWADPTCEVASDEESEDGNEEDPSDCHSNPEPGNNCIPQQSKISVRCLGADHQFGHESYAVINWFRGLSLIDGNEMARFPFQEWPDPEADTIPRIKYRSPGAVRIPYRYEGVVSSAGHRLSQGGHGLCQQRVWALVGTLESKESDLPTIVDAAIGAKLQHPEHDECMPSCCNVVAMNFTRVQQMHTEWCCSKGTSLSADGVGRCQITSPKMFGQQSLINAVDDPTSSTAWSHDGLSILPAGKPYMALSHVWSDGTGVGTWATGRVNQCLWDFLIGLSASLGCAGVWWDAVSVPAEKSARARALTSMHLNYSQAAVTLVHDLGLMSVEWKEDGSPALALVLSTWFTRGWTALELYFSKKVLVLFKARAVTGSSQGFVYKDLDTEILAQSVFTTTRAHQLATHVIKRLRVCGLRRPDSLESVLAPLRTRHSSWASDLPIITSLIAGVNITSRDSPQEIFRKIVVSVAKLDYSSLFHNLDTMRGNFEWCPPNLFDLPAPRPEFDSDMAYPQYFHIQPDGSLHGKAFLFFAITGRDIVSKRFTVLPNTPMYIRQRITMALYDGSWQKCLILLPPQWRTSNPPPPYLSIGLLVKLLRATAWTGDRDGTIYVCYIGAVRIPVLGADQKYYGGRAVGDNLVITSSLEGQDKMINANDTLQTLHWPSFIGEE